MVAARKFVGTPCCVVGVCTVSKALPSQNGGSG